MRKFLLLACIVGITQAHAQEISGTFNMGFPFALHHTDVEDTYIVGMGCTSKGYVECRLHPSFSAIAGVELLKTISAAIIKIKSGAPEVLYASYFGPLLGAKYYPYAGLHGLTLNASVQAKWATALKEIDLSNGLSPLTFGTDYLSEKYEDSTRRLFWSVGAGIDYEFPSGWGVGLQLVQGLSTIDASCDNSFGAMYHGNSKPTYIGLYFAKSFGKKAASR